MRIMDHLVNASLAKLAIVNKGRSQRRASDASASRGSMKLPPARKSRANQQRSKSASSMDTTLVVEGMSISAREKMPMRYPFFNYVDYSTEPDPDPSTPLTAIGRVPTFPAKLHAILLRSDTDLQGIVTWLPHGRSWKVLDAAEFEKRVIPLYFEFTKHQYSSFFRQAKLWGFRRMKREGPDIDSYYNPRFLRGLPHLCKDLKRPTSLPEDDVDLEPDLSLISDIYPVPANNSAADPTINLSWFLNGRSAAYPEAIIPKFDKPAPVKNRKRSHEVVAPEPAPSQYAVAIAQNESFEEVLHDDQGLNLDSFFSSGFNLYPFFDYEDYSNEEDQDPWTPLTAIGHTPSFPALMHAILMRTDLHHIVSWLRHGRSWTVYNVDEFERRVLPMYFQHSDCKYTSFLRLVKQWGFRRLYGQGPDQGSYYHPRFLRGLPHLCKGWQVNTFSPMIVDSEPDEPDLDRISEIFPVPQYKLAPEERTCLHWFLLGKSM